MKKVYENFIQCIKDRDYQSVAWILNYTDPKALYDLIFKMNLLISDSDKGPIVITKGEEKVATLSYSLENDWVLISVEFIKDEKTDCIDLMRSFYPKFQFITLSLLYIFGENKFSIDRCCNLEDCIYSNLEKEMINNTLVQDPNTFEEVSSNNKRTKKFNKYLKRIVKSLYPSILIKSKLKNEIDDDKDE